MTCLLQIRLSNLYTNLHICLLWGWMYNVNFKICVKIMIMGKEKFFFVCESENRGKCVPKLFGNSFIFCKFWYIIWFFWFVVLKTWIYKYKFFMQLFLKAWQLGPAHQECNLKTFFFYVCKFWYIVWIFLICSFKDMNLQILVFLYNYF